jgi:hypothetical protein
VHSFARDFEPSVDENLLAQQRAVLLTDDGKGLALLHGSNPREAASTAAQIFSARKGFPGFCDLTRPASLAA